MSNRFTQYILIAMVLGVVVGALIFNFVPDGRAELTWEGTIEPDAPLPAFIRTVLLRRSISEQFAGVVKEIERRADLWSSRSDLSH